jgi:hypothetical protein
MGFYPFLPPFYRQGVPARRQVVGWEANPGLVGRQVAVLGLQRDDSLISRASYILDHDMKNTRVAWALDLGSPLYPEG